MTRSTELYVSPRVSWLLRQIAKSMNGDSAATGDKAVTADQLADDILMAWIKQSKPKLIELFDRREAIETEAQEILKKS